ncbi:MAG TPA: class I SAM-dependent methyltransferase [Candidatus Fimivivens sp.]|nr:class I SAM-dependent methyltransferase [Candidatus Fimivivens sp.]
MNDENGVPEVYDKIAEKYAELFSEVKELFEEYVALLPENGRVIDIGCGVGTEAGYLSDHGFDVIGIDFSEGMLEQARKAYPDVDFRKADFREMPSDIGKADGVVASYSLIHIPKVDVTGVLQDIRRILKEEGMVFLGLQMGESGEMFVDEPLKKGEQLFLNIFSREEIERLLSGSGFRIIKSFSRKPVFGGELDFEKLHVIARKR